ncbi:hypothetical protein [Amycolatopsis circi]|uniref:hypothetical protein n=1 Tax=Amycolatopsis circi TaxID=871959 RepID=UPI0013BEA802|nr:hypothetical protein [Amycolatopsis circi]
MTATVAEVAAIVAASGTLIGSIARPLFKWLTARTFAAKALPQDLPKIAEALHDPDNRGQVDRPRQQHP